MTTTTHSHKRWTDKGGHVSLSHTDDRTRYHLQRSTSVKCASLIQDTLCDSSCVLFEISGQARVFALDIRTRSLSRTRAQCTSMRMLLTSSPITLLEELVGLIEASHRFG